MYVNESRRPFGPYQVVRLFERCLNDAGSPIEFTVESSEPVQLGHAKRLLRACKYRRSEVVALIEEYCADEWLVENQPDLAFVVRKVDELRARIARRQQAQSVKVSWSDLE